nr:hypothetical protein [Streptomyces sp. TS71-3]
MSESHGRSAGVPDDELLPCGRFLSVIWEAGHAGTAAEDPHMRTCPYCTAALHELRALDRFVEQARTADHLPPGADRPAPTVVGTPGAADDPFTARVMELVRLELRPGRSLPLGRPGEDLWIVEAAVAKAFRAAVDTLPGVRAGSCRVRPASPDADGQRGPVLVRIEVVSSLEHNLQDVAEAVRHRVLDTARRAVGLLVDAVDVTVADILDDGGRARGATFSDGGGAGGTDTGARGGRGNDDRGGRADDDA